MNDKCIDCGAAEGATLTFDNNRQVRVKFAKSRYGLLCQRCIRNAYARKTTKTKAQRRKIAEHKRMIEDTGQMSMFGDE